MKYRKILFIIVCYFAYASGVSADLCDKEHIKQLKELANQVEVNYEYIDYTEEIANNSEEGEYALNNYVISANLISDELFIRYNNFDYRYNDDNGGLINIIANSGEANLTIHSRRCADYKLRNVYLKMPKFNTYSYKEECTKLKDYDLEICDPWYQGIINDNYFYSVVNKYLNEEVVEESIWDNIIKFIQQYQLIIVGSVLLIVLGVIAILAYRKKSVLE